MKLYLIASFTISQLGVWAAETCRQLPDSNVSDCGADDFFQIQTITLHGAPTRGKSLAVSFSGILRKQLTPGTSLVVETKYAGFRVSLSDGDLCTLATQSHAGYPCPLDPQNITIDHSFDVPWWAPGGSYDIYSFAYSKTNQELAKVKVTVTI
ncbi:Phosphatidylglycerol/phosphatidylinositol transfer protein [Entomophthora muscae]|uniref:Phosphatidylglycerol/phosphatidylinositol transfer protein n=2 Tax=Entomophthora muscae TaxID=34485 RepID=A0ACC2S9B2_9FUNG|nr:Phosphatidylglycerol/phosphatidylinositol transfer protein [Entomophthora muscae]KAJ9064479.1 Phosphatidylglycerol/phosphatidylinositol transfer protein [Entomophthora muscae]